MLKMKPHLADSQISWWCSGSFPIPVSNGGYKKLVLWLLAFVVVVDVGTYSYYRGSVISPFHSEQEVNPTTYHIELSKGKLYDNGQVSVHAYLNVGTP
ncbi:hypothetical protein [Trabulsiella odontotermitis]|uniref:hypothetical protein n=1 Tax=Trabulsiella odontotermitis TaxID=379893 RepID=UPI0012D75B2D|nr:hypothetical protein [Trabulsiella odontotermitis]